MSQKLSLAQQHAWSLAKTLMVCITLFRAECGYGVVTSDEFDGDASSIFFDYDPFEIMDS